MASPTRSDVAARWEQLLSGDVSREDVHAWSMPWVEGDEETDDPVTHLGLQYLHGFDLSYFADTPDVVVHGGPPGRIYVRSLAEIAAELERWRQDAIAYDYDPTAWRRSRLVRLRQGLHDEGRADAAARVGRLIGVSPSFVGTWRESPLGGEETP